MRMGSSDTVRSGQGNRGAQPRTATRRNREEFKPRDGGRLLFPGYFPVTRDFPDFGGRKLPVLNAAMHGCAYSKLLIQHDYSQKGAPARIFLREFPALTGNSEASPGTLIGVAVTG